MQSLRWVTYVKSRTSDDPVINSPSLSTNRQNYIINVYKENVSFYCFQELLGRKGPPAFLWNTLIKLARLLALRCSATGRGGVETALEVRQLVLRAPQMGVPHPLKRVAVPRQSGGSSFFWFWLCAVRICETKIMKMLCPSSLWKPALRPSIVLSTASRWKPPV